VKAAIAAYQAAGWSGLALGWPFIAFKALSDSRYRVGWPERRGIWANPAQNAIWIHGASVGEIKAAEPLIRALQRRGESTLLTAASPSGRQTASDLLNDKASAHLLPLDLNPFVKRAMACAKPKALAIIETEIWPVLLTEAASEKIPAILANARISDRSYPKYKKIKRWIAPLLQTFAEIQAQSEIDAERLISLGAPESKVTATGNMKFDLPPPDPGDAVAASLARAKEKNIRTIVAGSTHKKDEEVVLEAVSSLKKKGANKIGLAIAPRHLERVEECAAIIESSTGAPPSRWSELKDPVEALEAGRTILVDVYGILGRLYGGAEVAVVGGTFAPVGGHNLLEPLNWGVPVIFGPNTQNARDIRNRIISLDLGAEAKDAQEAASTIANCLEGCGLFKNVSVRATVFFEENRGAVKKAIKALEACGALG